MSSVPPETETLISLENVGVSYWLKKGVTRRKWHTALEGITFFLNRGDSLGVIGRNGSGKSTLLSLLAGVIAPDTGRITRAGTVRSSLLTLQLGFLDYLSGRENALLSGLFLGMKKSDMEARMEQVIAFSELGEFIDQPLSTYSSGMRARLGFAVAMQLDPDVLLIDEVLGVGDKEFQDKSFRVIKERIHSESSTVVFVSHSAEQVRNLCTRAVWLEDGRLREAGEVNEVVDAYQKSVMERDKQRLEQYIAHDSPVFIRRKNYQAVYHVHQGRMTQITSWEQFCDLGGRADLVCVLTEEAFDEYKRKAGVRD